MSRASPAARRSGCIPPGIRHTTQHSRASRGLPSARPRAAVAAAPCSPRARSPASPVCGWTSLASHPPHGRHENPGRVAEKPDAARAIARQESGAIPYDPRAFACESLRGLDPGQKPPRGRRLANDASRSSSFCGPAFWTSQYSHPNDCRDGTPDPSAASAQNLYFPQSASLIPSKQFRYTNAGPAGTMTVTKPANQPRTEPAMTSSHQDAAHCWWFSRLGPALGRATQRGRAATIKREE